jgi:mannose-6-phosphate isomerase
MALRMKLATHLVEKPWGRTSLPPMFGDPGGRRIGEVWFAGPEDAPLLVKYIFTSERLSIQNHPSEKEARDRGLPSGKEECWYILDAEPGATLGLGLKREVSKDELRAAALDGSIEQLMEWKPVQAGDFFYVPAGTVHAIGAGISLLEFQQNADVTYRLYDYGRPRELHLDDGIAVARPRPYADRRSKHVDADEPTTLVDGPLFSLVQAVDGNAPADALRGRRRWIMPLDGKVRSVTEVAVAGECLLLEPGEDVDLGSGRVLIGADGPL